MRDFPYSKKVKTLSSHSLFSKRGTLKIKVIYLLMSCLKN